MRIGIYQQYWGRIGGAPRYIGVVSEVLKRHHAVEIVHHDEGMDLGRIEEALELDLSGVSFRCVPRLEKPPRSTLNPMRRLGFERQWRRELSEPYDLYIDSSDVPPFFCHARHGVLLTHFPVVSRGEFHGHRSEAWARRSVWQRLALRGYHRLEWRQRLSTYQLCIVNSGFTQVWMKRRWGMDSKVVFPPLRNGFVSGVKRPEILSIATFHDPRGGGHHKKHAVLIETFRRLCDDGLSGWTLRLVGACGSTDRDLAYLEELRRSAAGYPVEFEVNASGAVLRRRLEQASLLWHSMGYGVDSGAHPELMEHFGMVATEAMAAGCVPIAFRGGGLPESIIEGESGLLWSTEAELRASTKRLVAHDEERVAMSRSAVRRAASFDTAAFEQRLLDVLAPVLVNRGVG